MYSFHEGNIPRYNKYITIVALWQSCHKPFVLQNAFLLFPTWVNIGNCGNFWTQFCNPYLDFKYICIIQLKNLYLIFTIFIKLFVLYNPHSKHSYDNVWDFILAFTWKASHGHVTSYWVGDWLTYHITEQTGTNMSARVSNCLRLSWMSATVLIVFNCLVSLPE